MVNGRELVRKLEERGIYIKSVSYPGVAEEAGFAYKDIDAVVEATKLAGISMPVVKLVPLGNVKG
jgi:tRNA-splicing ligase RtcB